MQNIINTLYICLLNWINTEQNPEYVLNKWEKQGYNGYQINPEIMIGDAPKIQTPLGLNAMGFEGIGWNLPLFIQNYKGGRNESLMYG